MMSAGFGKVLDANPEEGHHFGAAAEAVATMERPPMSLRNQLIREVNAEGVTVLLVEQNARAALRLAHRAYVLETGRITAHGTAQELMSDELLQASYLGMA